MQSLTFMASEKIATLNLLTRRTLDTQLWVNKYNRTLSQLRKDRAVGRSFGPIREVRRSNERGLRLLKFATFNDLVLTNTFGHHKPSRRWTWHSPNGQRHSQTDYVLMRNRFRSGMNIARTRRFPGVELGVTTTCWWWPSTYAWKELASQNTQDSSMTSKSWKIPTCWKPSELW